MPLGIVVSLILAIIVGLPTFRLSGHYFSMATIAVAELIRLVVGTVDFLGAAIGSLANVFDPEVFVVGGGFGEAAADLLLEPAQEAARREAIEPADVTLRIVPAELGSDSGLVGAGLAAFEALDGTW